MENRARFVRNYLSLFEIFDDRARYLFELAVGRHLMQRDFRTLYSDNQLYEDLQFVADWIATALALRAEWLGKHDRRDLQKRPTRLLMMDSLDSVYRAAVADMLASNKPMLTGAAEARMGYVRTVMRFKDRHSIVRLLTREALDREAALMQICIDSKRYLASLKEPGRAHYSLRNQNNHPLATLDVRGELLLQCRGPNNQPMPPRCMAYIRTFMDTHHLMPYGKMFEVYMSKWQGHYHHVEALPEGAHLLGPVDLSETTHTIFFPRGTVIDGDKRIIINAKSATTCHNTDAEYVTIRHMNGAAPYRDGGEPAEETYEVATNRLVHSVWYADGMKTSEAFHSREFRARARFQVPVCVKVPTPSPSYTGAAVRARGHSPSPG